VACAILNCLFRLQSVCVGVRPQILLSVTWREEKIVFVLKLFIYWLDFNQKQNVFLFNLLNSEVSIHLLRLFVCCSVENAHKLFDFFASF
jgi:hypothetical protein